MLQDIRKSSQGTAAKIIIGLIVISFAGFGLQSILVDGGQGTVGEVNGETITPNEFNLAMNTQQRRLISMMGDNFDPSLLEPDRLKPQVLDSIVTRKLLVQSATAHDLAVSESEIGALIGGMEQFQVDGRFSPDVYRAALSNAGYDPAYFKQSLKEDLVVNQLRSGLAGSEFVTPTEMSLNAKIALEQRDIRYLTLPRENFVANEPPQKGDVEAYYANNQQQFQTEEAVDLDYIELVAADFVRPVDEQLIREAYELEIKEARYGVQNRVSHILLTEGVDEKLAAVETKLAEGVPFAEVAKTFSDDAGSANLGGDLGFTTGDAFPEEMEAALAELAVEEVSGPVETDAGTHILLVTERSEVAPPPFEELRPELESRIALNEAKVEIVRIVDTLKDLAFNADDLNEPAKELDLEVKQANGVTRTLDDELFSRPALRSLAFSEEVLDQGHNSDVIEIGDNHYVALRVREHHEPEILPIEVVEPRIIAAIGDQQTTAALNEEAQQLLTALQSGDSLESLAMQKGYEWQVELGLGRNAQNLSPSVMRRVFEMPAPEAEEAVADIVLSETGDVVLVQLVGVNAGDFDLLTGDQQSQLERAVTSELSALVDTQYMRGLREGAEINVL
ncbi:MAG: SurA N-terminal domain-containing protein [Halioglobus sp.]